MKPLSRFLGIDYGTKRIGVAITDENRTLAFPKEIILNDKNTLSKLGETIQQENVSEIVIGESLDFSGKPNVLAGKIEKFITELQKIFKLPIHKQQEFLTSVEARRYENLGGQARKSKDSKASLNLRQTHSKIKKEKSAPADAGAAALILQRYLDRKN